MALLELKPVQGLDDFQRGCWRAMMIFYFSFLILFSRIVGRAFFYLKYQVINISYQLLRQKVHAIGRNVIEVRSDELFEMTFSKL